MSSDLLYVNRRYHDLLYKLQFYMRKLEDQFHHQRPVVAAEVLRALTDEDEVLSTRTKSEAAQQGPRATMVGVLLTSDSVKLLSGVVRPYIGQLVRGRLRRRQPERSATHSRAKWHSGDRHHIYIKPFVARTIS
jgi:hypothetical protein